MDNATLPAKQESQDIKDLQLVDSSIALLQSAPALLRANTTSVNNALIACQAFIDSCSAADYKITAEMDNKAKDLLVKVNATVKKMKENREPLTQIFDAIKKMFTTLEGKLSLKEIDKLPAQVQKIRDDYARWCVEEEQRKKKEAEEKAALENEKANFKAAITTMIGELLAAYIANKKTQWTSSFNAITLLDFDVKATGIACVSTAFNQANFQKILNMENIALPATPRLQLPERLAIKEIATKEYDFTSWIALHDQQFEELKQKLIDSLPSKKQELEEAAEAERKLKLAQEEAAAAERKRQEEIAKANAAEKARLEEEASKARIAEMEQQKKLLAEQEKLAAEKKLREEADAAKIKAEQEEAAKKAAEEAEAKRVADAASNLFDSTLSMAENTPAPETRQGFNIIVTNPAGYAEMVSLWFQREGMKMSTDELEKMTFGRIKTYWEGVAKKTSEKISSKFLKYDIAVKAVNSKTK